MAPEDQVAVATRTQVMALTTEITPVLPAMTIISSSRAPWRTSLNGLAMRWLCLDIRLIEKTVSRQARRRAALTAAHRMRYDPNAIRRRIAAGHDSCVRSTHSRYSGVTVPVT